MILGEKVGLVGTMTGFVGSGILVGIKVGSVGLQVCSHGTVVGHGGLGVVVVVVVVELVVEVDVVGSVGVVLMKKNVTFLES